MPNHAPSVLSKPFGQIVCDDEAQNVATANILIEMDPQYLTSTDPLCPIKGGVLFWLVELTQEKIDALRKLKANVREVVASIPYHVPEAISNSLTESEARSAQKSEQTAC